MGEVVTSISVDEGKTDDHDPITGLTSRDEYLVNTTWNTVMQDPRGNGVAFFIRLFEINPKHQQAFPFRDQPIEELPTDKKFVAQVVRVMYSMTSVVKSLDDPEMLNRIIDRIMQNHVKRSVDREALIDVKQALLDILNSLKEEEIQSWTKFLDYFVEEGSKALSEHSTH